MCKSEREVEEKLQIFVCFFVLKLLKKLVAFFNFFFQVVILSPEWILVELIFLQSNFNDFFIDSLFRQPNSAKKSKIKFWNFWKKIQNSYPRPAPIKNETKLVIKTVKKTFLLVMKFLFLLSFEGNAESFELFELLILLEDEDFLLRIVANVHSLKNRKIKITKIKGGKIGNEGKNKEIENKKKRNEN